LVDGVNLYMYCKGDPVTFVDPNGLKIIAHTDRDKQLYALWAKTLKPEQARIVSELEQSDVIFNWRIADQPIQVKGAIPRFNIETGETKIPVASGEFTPSGDGSKREFDVNIYGNGIKSVKGISDDTLHELVGHGNQANEYLQTDMSFTGKDWGSYYKIHEMDFEDEAFKAQGTPKTYEELVELGYGHR